MASLATGYFRIESIPGRLCATADGEGKPILALPECEGPPWFAVYDETNKTYTIQFFNLSEVPGKLGWHYSKLQPDEPIILASPSQFQLNPVDGDPYLFNIRPIDQPIGVDICVGVLGEPNSAILALKYFVAGDPTERPAWRFILSPING